MTPSTNDKDIDTVVGPYMGSTHRGTGTINSHSGGAFSATSTGDVNTQYGTFIAAMATSPASITDNASLRIYAGFWDAGSSITNNMGISIATPSHESPLTNHYGIYLEDQDFGTNDSYAIYSEGGMNYLAGDLGIGTPQPQNALHVNGAIQLEEITEPANPATGFILFVDQADGNLKAKSSSGTVTTMATY